MSLLWTALWPEGINSQTGTSRKINQSTSLKNLSLLATALVNFFFSTLSHRAAVSGEGSVRCSTY